MRPQKSTNNNVDNKNQKKKQKRTFEDVFPIENAKKTSFPASHASLPECIYEPGSKLLVLGMVIQPLIGNPYNGYINPYYWVDDHPLLYGNNGSLDPGTYSFQKLKRLPQARSSWSLLRNLGSVNALGSRYPL